MTVNCLIAVSFIVADSLPSTCVNNLLRRLVLDVSVVSNSRLYYMIYTSMDIKIIFTVISPQTNSAFKKDRLIIAINDFSTFHVKATLRRLLNKTGQSTPITEYERHRHSNIRT